MTKRHPTDYFFIHFIETEMTYINDEDHLALNDLGYLNIGHAEWTPGHKATDNTFFNIEDARIALNKIKEALKFHPSKEKRSISNREEPRV